MKLHRSLALAACAPLVLVVASCADSDSNNASRATQAARSDSIVATPAGMACRVVEVEGGNISGIKRTVNVFLSGKTTADDLRAVALEIKDHDDASYERTFIHYWLPGMEVGAGAWASSHFNPDLKVAILGSTAEQDQATASGLNRPGVVMVGMWNWGQVGLTSLFKEDGQLWIGQAHNDGSSGKNKVVESKSEMGRRFDPIEKNPSGEFWLLTEDGRLEIRDGEGLIVRLEPYIR